MLDATAVTVSMVRGDFGHRRSVMFMLQLGEILEEWTAEEVRGRSRLRHGLRRQRLAAGPATEVLVQDHDVSRATAS